MTDGHSTAANPAPDRFYRALFSAVWMAIILGLLVQLAVLGAKLSVGGRSTEAQLIVDFSGGVAWSVIVCGAVAIGTAAARNAATTMGVLGLAFAPIAFATMKALQRGLSAIVGQPAEAITPLMFEMGGVKALEYAALGWLLGLIIHTPRSTLINHAGIGLGFGAVFASVMVWLLELNHEFGINVPMIKIAATATNEVLFPTGCSVVLYFVSQLAARGAAMTRKA